MRRKKQSILRAILAVILLAVLVGGCAPKKNADNETVEPTAAAGQSKPMNKPTKTPTPTVVFGPDTAQVESYTIDELRNKKEVVIPDFYTQKGERPLLVVLMDYENSVYAYDEAYEQAWSDYIFGTGTQEEGTASVNDYFQEVSNGKFRFVPILLGDNSTGVYTFHLNKEYSDEQFIHPEYPFFDFSYDLAFCMSELAEQGLNLDDFAADDIDGENYREVLMGAWDWSPNGRNKEYYIKPGILVVFPDVNAAKVDLTPINNRFDQYCLYAHVNETSSFGTICHELTHLMGAFDIYNFGVFGSDLMAYGINIEGSEYNVTHINPYYNVLYGWCDVDVLRGDGTYRLYSSATGKYRPLLIPTDDPNQYFLIEYRTAEGFDSQLKNGASLNATTGVTIWRVDQAAMNVTRVPEETRPALTMEEILSSDGRTQLSYFSGFNQARNMELKDAGIRIAVKSADENGTRVIEITRE